MVKAKGLRIQAVMSFHACGGNVGDYAQVPLPDWVFKVSINSSMILYMACFPGIYQITTGQSKLPSIVQQQIVSLHTQYHMAKLHLLMHAVAVSFTTIAAPLFLCPWHCHNDGAEVQCGEEDPSLFCTDRPRNGQPGTSNNEYISLFADQASVLHGRTALECYADFMYAFRETFIDDIGAAIHEIAVGGGPCGELRYPSYVETQGWRFPGVGVL